jgi:putative cell wall-binding protein/lysophospholipase L1-like esterase
VAITVAAVLAVLATMAGALAVPFVAPAGAAATIERIAGADRYETAAAVSRAAFANGAPVAFLASGTVYADALAAAPAATAAGGPVLLTAPDALPAATQAELGRLRPASVVVVGGTSAVSDEVASAAGATERVAGADRYETAAALARRVHPADGPVDAAYVASGESFPDALSGAAPAARDRAPILLASRTQVPPSTAAELARLRPRTTVVLGGPAAVDRSLDGAIAQQTGGAVGRSEGPDRWATSAAVAANAYPAGGATTTVYLASGTAFADGLAGAVLAAAGRAPVLLSPAACMPDAIAAAIDRLAPARLVVLGGESAVGPAALARTTCRRPHDPRPVTRSNPVKVLMLGDSTATAPAYSLTRMLNDLGGSAAPDKAIGGGTGFARPDVLDWVDYSRRIMAERDPDIVTMIIGANDGQGMTLPDGRVLRFGTAEWKAEYARRVGAAMDAMAVDGRMVVWMSEPPMGREPLNSEMMLIDDLVASVARTREVVWLDTRPLFGGPNGEYVNNGWRTSDGVHFTVAGGDRLASAELQLIRSRWGF